MKDIKKLYTLQRKYVMNRGMIMFDNESIEKVQKHFMNFKKEEEWLQKKLNAGWLLLRYIGDVDEATIYTFKSIDDESQKKIVYKVDFREFDKKEEYEDYIEMFSESGWHSLAKKDDGKHIFYTNSKYARKQIFSEVESFREREERKIQSSFKNGMINFGFVILSIFLYIQFDNVFFIGAGLYAAFAMCKSIVAYISHKKELKSMATYTL